LGTDSDKDVQYGEFIKDWNYDQPLNSDANDKYYMKKRIEALIKGCLTKKLTEKDKLDIWSEWDINPESSTLSTKEVRHALRTIIPRLLGLEDPCIDRATGLPCRVLKIDKDTGLPFEVFNQGDLSIGEYWKRLGDAASGKSLKWKDGTVTSGGQNSIKLVLKRILTCSIPHADPESKNIMKKLDTGGERNFIEKVEFFKDVEILDRTAKEIIKKCIPEVKSILKKEFKETDKDGNGSVDAKELAAVLKNMAIENANKKSPAGGTGGGSGGHGNGSGGNGLGKRLNDKLDKAAKSMTPLNEKEFNLKKGDLEGTVDKAEEDSKKEEEEKREQDKVDKAQNENQKQQDKQQKEKDKKEKEKEDHKEKAEEKEKEKIVKQAADALAKRKAAALKAMNLCDRFDYDRSGSISEEEFSKGLSLTTSERIEDKFGTKAKSNKIVQQCVSHGVHELSAGIVRRFDVNGVGLVQKEECKSVDNVRFLLDIISTLAERCHFLWRSELEKLWKSYDINQSGSIESSDLTRVFKEMLDFAKAFYGENYENMRECLAPKVPKLVATCMSAMDKDGDKRVKREEFDENPHVVFLKSEEEAIKCEEEIRGEKIKNESTHPLLSYDLAYSSSLWKQYTTIAGKDSKGALSEFDFEGVLKNMVEYANKHTKIPKFDEITKCIEGENSLKKSAQSIVGKLSNGKQVVWDQFRHRPNTVIHIAEKVLESCERKISSTSTSDPARFMEKYGMFFYQFGQYRSGFLPPSQLWRDDGVSFLELSQGPVPDGQDVPDTPEIASTDLVNRVAITTADSGQEFLSHALSLALGVNLKHALNRTISRRMTRAITKTLTAELTDQLVPMILRKASDPYVKMATRMLVSALTPSLSHSLAIVTTHAMSRHPEEDYFCYYCLMKESYCEYCKDSATRDHWLDYYTSYYAQYYGDKYKEWYTIEVDLRKLMALGKPYRPRQEPPARPVDLSKPEGGEGGEGSF